jgi:hypothetical protein
MPCGDQTIARVVSLPTEDETMPRPLVKLPDDFGYAATRILHQVFRAHSSGERRLLRLPHFFASHEHGSNREER